MKKNLLLFALFIYSFGFSQIINVNTTAYTVPQLVNTVLINSPCVSATNVTSKTGVNFGSTNGIGYFENKNPKFPIKSGVILSTGDVKNAIGPNTSELNDGNLNWPGDADLEKTLADAGITMKSTNASVLEFDFTPISTSFSFEFLFASEEYGNYQCQFSDAFAFLLTNLETGVTTNLAVVPGTNLPISVVTIRDYLYNSSCPSANVDYFGSYNGDSAAATSATNFNGQTTIMNASAILVPDTPYHIKLVIADRTDSGSDSAIFIASDAFNIGQDVLGVDLTFANNNALCSGTSKILNSNLSPTDYTFTWTKDGFLIPGAVGPSLTITNPGNYGITYNKIINNCEPTTDYIKVEYFTNTTTKDPEDLFKCDSGLTAYTYDLSSNTPIVKTGLNALTEVSYYSSSRDANLAVNALPNSYTAAPGTPIFIRIKNYNNSCYIVKSFKLLTVSAPVATQPDNLTSCSTSSLTSTAGFKLTEQNNAILNGLSEATNTVTYYETEENANSGINPILSNLYIATNEKVIYARVENTYDKSCYSITNFKLYVNQSPIVDLLTKVVACSNYTLEPLVNGNYFLGPNGMGTPLFAGDIITETKTIFIFNQPGGPGTCSSTSSFKITIIEDKAELPKSGTYCGDHGLATMPYGEYYTEKGGKGTRLPAGTVITETKDLFFYYKTPTAPFCEINIEFTVTIIPLAKVGTFKNVFSCTSYILPTLKTGNYYTQPLGSGSKLEAGTELTSSQRIYVFSPSEFTYTCYSEAFFEVVIGIKKPENISQCEPYTLPELSVGKYYTEPKGNGEELVAGSVINTSKVIYIYAVTLDTPNCTDQLSFNVNIRQPQIDVLTNVEACEFFILPKLIKSGAYYTATNGGGKILYEGDHITSTQKIYIFRRTEATCSNESSFLVTIYKKPLIDSRSDIDICNFYKLTPLAIGNYYTGPGGTGTKLLSGSLITSSQTIYIYGNSHAKTGCSKENDFDINIFSIVADQPDNVTVCDSYVLPALKIGNYYSTTGGPSVGNKNLMKAGDVITNTQTIYVYTESGERINCTDENIFTVTINKTPILAPVKDVNACSYYILPKLAVGNYFTGKNGTGIMLKENDTIKSNQKIFIYGETKTTPNCADEKSFNINIFILAKVKNVTICESYILPNLTIGKYYTGSNATGKVLNPGTAINETQRIYVYSVSPLNSACYDETSFVITIVDTPVANAVPESQTTLCDEDIVNDGIVFFDLTKLNDTVLGNQTGPEFTINYYASQLDAVTNNNPIVSTNLKTVFVKVTNTLTENCYDLQTIQFHVNKAPIPSPRGGIVCYDTTSKTLIKTYTIPSGLNPKEHTFQWINEKGTIVGTASTYEAKLAGIYTLIATSTVTGCSSYPYAIEVNASEPAKIKYTLSDDFSENQILTIEALGSGGDYEYQLDSNTFQDSPIYSYVSSGTHTITVRDKNGCGNSVARILVVDYPKFFTPNGDGFNDTWNITDLKDQKISKISIYDRYGKVITQIKPSGSGWDGTYVGKNLPSTDYWFTVEYIEDGVTKEFRSHFTMKR